MAVITKRELFERLDSLLKERLGDLYKPNYHDAFTNFNAMNGVSMRFIIKALESISPERISDLEARAKMELQLRAENERTPG